jgi:Putative auto-transporter adhesin, head GIN domain
MKAILFFVLVFAGTGVFAQHFVIDDPNAEVRKVEQFTSIKISGGFEVYITQGNEDAVAVSAANTDTRNAIKTEVNNGVLTISLEGQWYKRSPFNKKLKAYISCTNLDLLEGTGACDFKIDDTIHSDNLSIHLTGASEIEGDVEATNLVLDLVGASEVKLKGSAQTLKISAKGASDIKSYDLQTDHCIADLNGASDVRLTINKSLSAAARGASTLYYHGNPERTDITANGASSISQRN